MTDNDSPFDFISDDFKQQFLEVCELIESTVARRRAQVARISLVTEVKPDGRRVATAARQLISQARQSADVLVAGDPRVGREVASAAVELLPRRTKVGVRVLCTPAVLDRRLLTQPPDPGGRLEVRVSRSSQLTAVIVDGRTALVCAESAVGGRASVIQSVLVIRALRTLFDGIWQGATVASDQVAFGDHVRSDTVRQVLGCLRLGLTDEVAARDLSVSVRTYRRYVAEIMTLLGADSRFQAGVRSARLGLLPPSQAGSE